VGRSLHEDPEVPGYLNRKIEKTPKLIPGMTIAIEVIYNMGKPDVSFYGDDGWTIGSSDGSLSGLFERSILITEKDPEILT
jgi:methionyl aminopeptidase